MYRLRGMGSTSLTPVSDARAAQSCDSFTCASPGYIDSAGNLNVLVENLGGVAYSSAGVVSDATLAKLGLSKPSSGTLKLTQSQAQAVLAAMQSPAKTSTGTCFSLLSKLGIGSDSSACMGPATQTTWIIAAVGLGALWAFSIGGGSPRRYGR